MTGKTEELSFNYPVLMPRWPKVAADLQKQKGFVNNLATFTKRTAHPAGIKFYTKQRSPRPSCIFSKTTGVQVRFHLKKRQAGLFLILTPTQSLMTHNLTSPTSTTIVYILYRPLLTKIRYKKVPAPPRFIQRESWWVPWLAILKKEINRIKTVFDKQSS